MGDFEQMGKVAKEIAHTRTPLNNCEPIVIIMHIIEEKKKKKRKKREKEKEYIYIYIIKRARMKKRGVSGKC